MHDDRVLTGEPPPTAVYLDLETTLLEARWEPRGPELHLRPGVLEGLLRLRQVADHVVVLVEPPMSVTARRPDLRLEVLGEALGPVAAGLLIVTCPHLDVPDGAGEDAVPAACTCAKPGTGLVDAARRNHGLDERGGWHVGGDQLGVQGARAAGLRTIRIGPPGEDHLSAVHRADHEARDLLAAANLVMMETLTTA
ncbi:MAG: hypothetical protein H0W07_06200 [Chloroflexi bacterium]|nr:hypothetical protein [Chloroflexota bacterium]